MAYPSNHQPTVSSDSVAQDQIQAFIERIMRMREEASAINDDIREIYAEAKGNGFDKTVLGKLVLYIEKRAKDLPAVLESEALFDLYLEAFDNGPSRTHAHEAHKPEATPRKIESAKPGAADALDTQSTAALTEVRGGHLSRPLSPPDKGSIGAPPIALPGDGGPAEKPSSQAGTQARPVDTISAQPEPSGVAAGTGGEGGLTPVLSAEPKPIRPHCLNRTACAGQGRKHCFSCDRAHTASLEQIA